MTVHIVKLCVGAQSVDDLAAWQRGHRTKYWKSVKRTCAYHTTRQRPRREQDVLNGGSIYWVIKGIIQVRQRIVGLENVKNEKGIPSCALLLEPKFIPVAPQPRRAFQGWRYLDVDDAPADISAATNAALKDMPHKLRRELAALCLI